MYIFWKKWWKIKWNQSYCGLTSGQKILREIISFTYCFSNLFWFQLSSEKQYVYRKSSKETRGSYSFSEAPTAGLIRILAKFCSFYLLFFKFTAGLIRMRVLFEGGSLSRIYGMYIHKTYLYFLGTCLCKHFVTFFLEILENRLCIRVYLRFKSWVLLFCQDDIDETLNPEKFLIFMSICPSMGG